MISTNEKKCKDRVGEELKKEIETLKKLWELYQHDPDSTDPDLGSFDEHGLSFDYVAPGTFEGQRRGYFRYQISWGGPSDEFRFYTDENFNPVRIEYWFLDWYDGSKKILKGSDELLLLGIFDWFKECETVKVVYDKAMESV